MSGPLRDLEASRERSALDPATAQPEKNPSTSTAKLAVARIQRSGAAPVAALRSLQRSRGNAFVQQVTHHMGQIERGESNLTLETIFNIAGHLEITVHELLKGIA